MERAVRPGDASGEPWPRARDRSGSARASAASLAATPAEGAERRLRAVERLLALIEDFVYLLDPAGRVIYANRPALELLGRDAREVYGKHLAEVDRGRGPVAPLAGRLNEVITGRRTVRGEYAYAGAHGKRRHHEYILVPVLDDRGEVEAIGCVGRDITARLQAERERAELLESRRRSQRGAEARVREERGLSDAIAAVTESQSTEEVLNRLVETAVAATGAEGAIVERIRSDTDELEVVAAAGKPAVELGRRVPYARSFAAEVVESGRPMVVARDRSAERPTHLPPGCAGLVVPLVDAGVAIGALVLMRCVDDRRFKPEDVERAGTFGGLASLAFHKLHVLEESKRGRAELTRVTESRARLMRGFSHDLKNPLGAAYGHLEMVEMGMRGEVDDAARESVSRARSAIRSALRLIDDLLELARAEAGHFEVRRVAIDLRTAVREVAEEYRASAVARGMRVEVDIPREFPIIESDAHRIRQILGNLIGNALKYASGDGRVTIALRTRRSGDPAAEWATIDVADDGPGIPAERLPYIFDEFQRADAGSGMGGAGIGLAISQRVAHALGGRITVESGPGRGSVFTLWLPIESS